MIRINKMILELVRYASSLFIYILSYSYIIINYNKVRDIIVVKK